MKRRGFLKQLAALAPMTLTGERNGALRADLQDEKYILIVDGRVTSGIKVPPEVTVVYLFPQPGQKLDDCVRFYELGQACEGE
jgi:hypothetical protein